MNLRSANRRATENINTNDDYLQLCSDEEEIETDEAIAEGWVLADDNHDDHHDEGVDGFSESSIWCL